MKNPACEIALEPATAAAPCSCSVFTLWRRRHRTRHQLRLLLEQDPARLYGDLGLTEVALRQECCKWFWES